MKQGGDGEQEKCENEKQCPGEEGGRARRTTEDRVGRYILPVLSWFIQIPLERSSKGFPILSESRWRL